MNKKLFVEFYKIGLAAAQNPNSPPMINNDCDEVAGEIQPHEYAFYFARQCVIDVKSRSRKDWSKLSWFEWKLAVFGGWVRSRFERKHKEPTGSILFSPTTEEAAQNMTTALKKMVHDIARATETTTVRRGKP